MWAASARTQPVWSGVVDQVTAFGFPPSDYKPNIQDISKAERNANGDMIISG